MFKSSTSILGLLRLGALVFLLLLKGPGFLGFFAVHQSSSKQLLRLVVDGLQGVGVYCPRRTPARLLEPPPQKKKRLRTIGVEPLFWNVKTKLSKKNETSATPSAVPGS